MNIYKVWTSGDKYKTSEKIISPTISSAIIDYIRRNGVPIRYVEAVLICEELTKDEKESLLMVFQALKNNVLYHSWTNQQILDHIINCGKLAERSKIYNQTITND